jgi:hypothetical protein
MVSPEWAAAATGRSQGLSRFEGMAMARPAISIGMKIRAKATLVTP